MNHFPQLTPIENKLKQIYQQSLERSLQEPCDREDVMDVLLASYTITNDNNITKSLTTHIDEQTFILENMDISFVRHARYTPAFGIDMTFLRLSLFKMEPVQTMFSVAVFL